jgi:hypothetical protein
LKGAKIGAISGTARTAITLSFLGAAYKPSTSHGDFDGENPVYRRGTILSRALFRSGGIAIGRNLLVHKIKVKEGLEYRVGGKLIDPKLFNQRLEAHETAHYVQQRNIGFANFYLKVLWEYITIGRENCYCTPGTLEWNADTYSIDRIGSFYK